MFIPSRISSQTSILPQMEQGRISQLSELANPGRSKNNKNTDQHTAINRDVSLLRTKGYLLKTLDHSECIFDVREKLERVLKKKDQQRSYIRNLP